MRQDEKFTHLKSIEHSAIIARYAVKWQIETLLEPIGDAYAHSGRH